MINFPDAPTNGQFYTPPGLSGSWKWDGQKWIASSETSSNYLPLTGGTLTGPLIIASDRISVKSAGDALAFLDKSTGATNQALLVGSRNGLNRWSVGVGTNETETGGNAGSNFGIASWDDAGGFLALPLKINRANSTATFSGNVGLGGYAVPSDTLNGTLMTGTNFATVGGGLSANIYGTSSAIWKYLGNGAGSLIASNGAGGWDWYTAASGTAGAVATITRTMRLDSNGNATRSLRPSGAISAKPHASKSRASPADSEPGHPRVLSV